MSTKSKKGAGTTEVAQIATNPVDFISFIQEAKKQVEHITTSSYKLSAKTTVRGVTIQEDKSKESLISLVAYCISYGKHYSEAAAELGLETFPAAKVDGCLIEEIVADCKLRIAIIDNEEILKKIEKYEAQAKELLSAEEKRQMLLRDMTADPLFQKLGK